MRFAPYFLGLCAGLGLLACSSSTVTTPTIVRPQLLAVSPDDFLGVVPCRPDFETGGAGGGAGALTVSDEPVAKSYVATVRDVTLKDANNPAAGTVDFVPAELTAHAVLAAGDVLVRDRGPLLRGAPSTRTRRTRAS